MLSHALLNPATGGRIYGAVKSGESGQTDAQSRGDENDVNVPGLTLLSRRLCDCSGSGMEMCF